MQILEVLQGSPQWHAHRAQHFNASDAPAMMGCSPYKSRSQLIKELATGIGEQITPEKQRIFDAGHRYEALARPLAERIIGEELYPVTGTEGRFSASFDGLTLDEQTAFEHKSLNDELRAVMVEGCTGADLPLLYRVQMEHQCMVAGCARILFMASKWAADGTLIEERHCWYTPDLDLRAQIIAGWAQLEADVCAYQPPAASSVEKVVAEPVEALPAPVVQVTGQIALKDNFKVFEDRLRQFLDSELVREPRTDEDFATLDLQIKAMKAAEEALQRAEAQMLAQIQSVDQAKRTKDMLADLVRKNRLLAERLLKEEKDRRREQIVASGKKALADHIAALNGRLGMPYMPAIPADFVGAIKGLKSLASMEDRVATELARAKIAANEAADRIDANLKHLRDHAADHKHLFPDAAQIVLKAPEDLQALVTARIAEHRAAEERRLEAERARIRAEEEARAAETMRREQAAREAEERRAREAAEETERQREAMARAAVAAIKFPEPQKVAPAAAQAEVFALSAPQAEPIPERATAWINTAQLGERLGVPISAALAAELGHPGTKRTAPGLYWSAASVPAIGEALIAHIREHISQPVAA